MGRDTSTGGGSAASAGAAALIPRAVSAILARIERNHRAMSTKPSRFPLVWRILAGFLLGIALGLAASRLPPETSNRLVEIATPFGAVLVSMLKMVVYPIIFFSLVLGAASMPLRSSGSPANYRKYLLYISGGCVIDSLTCLIYNDRLTVNDILEYDLHSRKRCIDTAVGSVIQVHLLYVL